MLVKLIRLADGLDVQGKRRQESLGFMSEQLCN